VLEYRVQQRSQVVSRGLQILYPQFESVPPHFLPFSEKPGLCASRAILCMFSQVCPGGEIGDTGLKSGLYAVGSIPQAQKSRAVPLSK
jgi:hypothetical protein